MYFGTNGVRGLFSELNPSLALKVAQAVGMYFKKGKIIVARDCRLTGDVLRSAVVSGLASVGCDVVELGITSAPTAEYMIKKLDADGCIIITASHNPPEWNALKVVDGKGIAVSKERGEEIEKLMDSIGLAEWDRVGSITFYDRAVPDHIQAIKEHVDTEKIRKRKPKLVLDCGNGTASVIAPRLFKELGADIITLNSHLDGRFPGRPSEPSEKNVQELIAAVESGNADAGIAWDADGDRVIFVDEKGNYVIGDRVYALCVLWKLSGKKGDAVTTVATSRAVEDVAERFSCRVRYTAIGAPYLCEEIVSRPAVIGGEEVGGVIWPELSLAKDGMLTAAKLAEALCEKKLSSWLEEIPAYHNVKLKIEAQGEKKKQIVQKALDYAKENNRDYVDVDGVRINLEDSWVIIRPSGTEDYVRLFAEAKTKEKAERLAEEYRALVT
ncbi:phosphoglucosamine mutase [Candidatus Micrarchaeota archaeon]|nr:phosphoglucosamine mutase [Candidatus Micrarchaeota archaeon]